MTWHVFMEVSGYQKLSCGLGIIKKKLEAGKSKWKWWQNVPLWSLCKFELKSGCWGKHFQVDLRLGFYVFGISRARRMRIDRVLIHTKFFNILPSYPPTLLLQQLWNENPAWLLPLNTVSEIEFKTIIFLHIRFPPSEAETLGCRKILTFSEL